MSDTSPAAPAAEAVETVPTPAAPSPASAPACETAAVAQEDAELDILNIDDAEDVGEGDGEAEGGEAGVKPIGPGDDATDEEVAAWRREHGVPDDAADYQPPQIENVPWNQEALSPILQAAHRHNVPQQAVADALAEYAKGIQAQQAALKVRDAEDAKAVRSTLSADEVSAVKSAAKAMSAELRSLLNQARAPDGSRIINNPEVLRMIAATYGVRPAVNGQIQDRTNMLQNELAELDGLMASDIDQYRGSKWKNTGISPMERRMQISRELMAETPAPPSAASVAAEMRKLEELRHRDPQLYAYGSWPGARSPADRHFELKQRRRA